jgi:hypothetical protein
MEEQAQTLHVCIICRFTAELDDAVIPTTAGRCICLRCFSRETGSAKVLNRRLRDELNAVLELGDTASQHSGA